jgi:hypothetical protein
MVKKKKKKEKNKAHTKTAPEFAVKKDLNFNSLKITKIVTKTGHNFRKMGFPKAIFINKDIYKRFECPN